MPRLEPRKTARVLVACTILAALALHERPVVRAQDIAPPPVADTLFGTIALAIGETARVNVSQVGDPNLYPAGAACGIIINYFGADGRPLTVPLQGELGPGNTIFADLDRMSLTGIRANRVAFRVSVRLVGDPNIVPDPCAKVRSTIEVFDDISGRTLVFIGDPND